MHTVLDQMFDFCTKGLGGIPRTDLDLPFNGRSNENALRAPLLLVVAWINNESYARQAISYRPDQITLADLVGMAVHETTRLHFSWTEACTIVSHAGNNGLFTQKLERLVAKHERATDWFLGNKLSYADGMSPKRLVQNMAKTTIWALCFALLTSHNYEMPDT